ncbi:unnamed protein product [Rotaria socialis]|uniref:DNA polymerase subunit gamma-2, mitochondrial n=1 Tax=Rotaria socialis TaxID=392032 RepID=A0A821EE49_9BILA|nr:unnamed protein product [Rotaria socialis]CAF3537888.1 unnamed protein product [Rotaria socialis]CAF4143047.1 unnamed protein product [Rotaria socialis]CAF4636005.1 unnamed protein product [Rotaria socialis]
MLSQIQQLAQKGLQNGFLKSISSTVVNNDASSLIFHYGPFASNLFYYFRHEWIKSFIKNNGGQYNFLWVDSIDQVIQTPNMTIGWQTKLPNSNSHPPLLLKRENQEENDDYLCINYIKPVNDINLVRLANERTSFWKKYFSKREKLEVISIKQNQFNINYHFSSNVEPYHLETIQSNNNSSLNLLLNINHTLVTLLIDSEMKSLHPLLAVHQIGIKSTSKTTELSFYLSKLLSYKYHLRVLRLNDDNENADHIPFHILLNDDSIKNGLCLVWNRDTQLNEQIHVKQVAKHLADYFHSLEYFV